MKKEKVILNGNIIEIETEVDKEEKQNDEIVIEDLEKTTDLTKVVEQLENTIELELKDNE